MLVLKTRYFPDQNNNIFCKLFFEWLEIEANWQIVRDPAHVLVRSK